MFTKEEKIAIQAVIKKVESKTSGEISVHVRQKCHDNPYDDAVAYFNKIGLDKTRERNAVLIFIGQTSRRFAIIGDQGIHDKVHDSFWEVSRDKMVAKFKHGQFSEGVIDAIEEIGERLAKHFPKDADDNNEIANEITND